MSFAEALSPDPRFSLIFFAPFYNRSGYGVAARGLATAWHRLGIPLRIVSVDEVEAGIDDCDVGLLKSLETAPVTVPLAAIFFHVPNPAWLSVTLPAGSLRIMYTTFDGYARGGHPPIEWIRICNQMDQIWVMTAQEAAVWVEAGAIPAKLRVLPTPHPWVDNPVLPLLEFQPKAPGAPFRFLSMGMFQPRRRWDTLIEAFLLEFKDAPGMELTLKVNYPPWHPVPGRPQQDLHELIEGLKARSGSRAEVRLDESLGSRLGICRLLDSSDVYVSTDTTSTAPIGEAHVRGRLTVLPESYGRGFGDLTSLYIPEDPGYAQPMTEAMLAYQPHHRGISLPLLHVEDVRATLRAAYELPEPERLARGRATALSAAEGSGSVLLARYLGVLREGFEEKRRAAAAAASSTDLAVRWEGSQFLYHSLAHVNRQLCLGLLRAGNFELSLLPYEQDQFDGMADPVFRPLAERVNADLARPAQVHVRHQWPPHFEPPAEGAWVMIQPWEFGGIPAEWVAPMRDLVDELWVPTSWVKDCYVKSGIPAERIVVIPNGVDASVFAPEGPRYPLQTAKRFKFLFLGGTLYRKGIDILLKAYLKAFRATDDVCLVIKGQFGATYQGTEIDVLVENLRKEDPAAPEIEYRVEGLSEPEVVSLYRACDAFVLPYRGEGFGLPIAEAMACGLPVIVTARGASADFVQDAWAYRIPSQPRAMTGIDRYHPSQAGFWLEEPDEEALGALMREAYEHPEEARAKGRRGREYACQHLGWDRPVAMVAERLAELAGRPPRRLAPGEPQPPSREAFLHEPDWSGAEWVEVLLSYLSAFSAGEPVSLVLPLASEGRPAVALEEAQQAVLSLVQRMGLDVFPDIVLVDPSEDLPGILQGFSRIHQVPRGRGAVAGLEGVYGERMAAARSRLTHPSA